MIFPEQPQCIQSSSPLYYATHLFISPFRTPIVDHPSCSFLFSPCFLFLFLSLFFKVGSALSDGRAMVKSRDGCSVPICGAHEQASTAILAYMARTSLMELLLQLVRNGILVGSPTTRAGHNHCGDRASLIR